MPLIIIRAGKLHEVTPEEQRRDRLKELKRTKWGVWELDKDRLVLDYYRRNTHWYEIDLERCLDAAEILDWVVQLSHKNWVHDDPKILFDLIFALDELLDYNLQGRACPGGRYMEKPIDWKEVLSKREDEIARLQQTK